MDETAAATYGRRSVDADSNQTSSLTKRGATVDAIPAFRVPGA
jgi:hypothetical protein